MEKENFEIFIMFQTIIHYIWQPTSWIVPSCKTLVRLLKPQLRILTINSNIEESKMIMKKVLILTVFLISSLSIAQGLTSTKLIDLCDQSLGEVQEYMTSNNWHFYLATDETEKNYGNAKFVYDRPKFDPMKDTAVYFSTYYYSEVDNSSAIEIYFRDKIYYESFLSQIASLKFKLIDSKTRFLFAKKSDYKKIRIE